MSRLTVFSKANCVQCNATYRSLNKLIDVGQLSADDVGVVLVDGSAPDLKKLGAVPVIGADTIDPQAAYTFIAETLGYQQVPVVTAGYGQGALDAQQILTHWSGYNPDRLAAAATAVNEAVQA